MNYTVLKTILHNADTFVVGHLIKLDEAQEASTIEALIEVGAIAPDPVPEPVEETGATPASTKKSKTSGAADPAPAAEPAAAQA